MNLQRIERHLDTTTSRRTIVKTGVKLAYAAPIVAATMSLMPGGARAGVAGGTCCPPGTVQIPALPDNTGLSGPLLDLARRIAGQCIKCSDGTGFTLPDGGLAPSDWAAFCQKIFFECPSVVISDPGICISGA